MQPAPGKAEQGLSLLLHAGISVGSSWSPPLPLAPQPWAAPGVQGLEETHGVLVAPSGAGAFPAWGARGGPCSKKTSILDLFDGKCDFQALRRCALVRLQLLIPLHTRVGQSN